MPVGFRVRGFGHANGQFSSVRLALTLRPADLIFFLLFFFPFSRASFEGRPGIKPLRSVENRELFMHVCNPVLLACIAGAYLRSSLSASVVRLQVPVNVIQNRTSDIAFNGNAMLPIKTSISVCVRVLKKILHIRSCQPAVLNVLVSDYIAAFPK